MAETLRELTSGATNNVLKDIARWTIKQDSPTSIFASQTSLEAFSNIDGAYQGLTASKKIICRFDKLNPGTYAILAGAAAFSATITYAYSLYNRANWPGATVTFRIRPILEIWTKFVPGPTWNDFINGPPSLGAVATITGGGGHSIPGTCGAVPVSIDSQSDFIGGIGTLTSTVPVFGFAIDVAPVMNPGGPTNPALQTLTKSEASLSVGSNGAPGITAVKF